MNGIQGREPMNTTRTGENVFANHPDFQIGLASTASHRRQCNELVNAMYSWRGYDAQRDAQASSPYEMTLQASRAGRVVGTLTICRDSLSGIPADSLYRDEIDCYRGRGVSVFEVTRFAIEASQRSRELIGALFYHAYVHAGICGGLTDAFIEVNPRHVAFYKRLLRFDQIGEQKICPRVNAPAVLLHRAVASITRQIAECREMARGEKAAPQPHMVLAGIRPTAIQRQPAFAA
jgi:hypothetical protein